MKEKAHSEIPKKRLSSDEVMMEDDFYTTHSGRQVRRRRSLPDQMESGMFMFISSLTNYDTLTTQQLHKKLNF